MKPKYPLTQPFAQLPAGIPIHVHNNALLPGGELPLEIKDPPQMALFFDALRSDQMIGVVQPNPEAGEAGIYRVGCAGRIRQYRERKDGRINVMLTGFCRFDITAELPADRGYRRAAVDWGRFALDYQTLDVAQTLVDTVMANLRDYFQRHQMQVDWEALNKAHIEEVVNNLVLVMNFTVAEKQLLLEALTVEDRLHVFNELLTSKGSPIWTGSSPAGALN